MSTKPKKIFVVDDDKMMATMISDHLRENPMHEVIVFTTGEDCVKNLALSPDVIILDFNLNSVVPDAANGMQILQQIKKFDPEVHVIMLSSQDDYGKALDSIVKGALEYVVKDQEAFGRIDHILGE